MLEKLKQQLLDHLVLLIILTATTLGTLRSIQVNVQVKELVEMQAKITQLENTCVELARIQEELDDLRLEFVKHVASGPIKKSK